MRSLPLWSVVFMLLSLAACQRERHPPDPTGARAVARREHAEDAVRGNIFGKLDEARRRFEQAFDVEPGHAVQRCPDPLLPAEESAATTLVVRVFDARSERRELVPLKLTSSLESDEFTPIVEHLSGGASALWDRQHAEPRSRAEAQLVSSELRKLELRRYRAVLWIDAYTAPKLFRRKDALRSEWAPGAIAGRLVIGELATASVLCQAAVRARGDAAGEPVSRRLREATRLKLETELADLTWSAMASALSGISSVLRLPPVERRGDVSQRWAAPPSESRVASAEPTKAE